MESTEGRKAEVEEPACYSLSLSSGDSYSGHLPPGSPISHPRLGNVWPTASPSPRTLPILLCGLPDLGPRPGTETPPTAPPDHPPGSQVHPAPSPACRALLSDRGSAAVIVSGFLSLPPLLVLASAARAHLARRLHSLLPPPTWSPGPRRQSDGEKQLCAWV